MSLEALNSRFRSRLRQLGKAGLNALFPDEFEYYLLAFELVDSEGHTIDYFTFPVLPESIMESAPEITNNKKTAGGVVSYDNPSFVPKKIVLSGVFGRKFRILINNNQLEFAGIRSGIQNGIRAITNPGSIQLRRPVFSSFAKTGYGCVKVIEAIKNKSTKLDEFGKPYRVYMYNPILGNNYIVKFDDLRHSQSESKNMIPKYDILLTAIAPLDQLGESSPLDLIKNIGAAFIQRRVNNVASSIRGRIGF